MIALDRDEIDLLLRCLEVELECNPNPKDQITAERLQRKLEGIKNGQG